MTERADFYIVGMGASAGGLEALEKFFAHMAADSGLAFIIIQHLSPDHKSLMVDILSKRTPIPVYEAQDGMPVEPNCIYLLPPKKNMTLSGQALSLTDRQQDHTLNFPIDIFLNSLAENMEEKAIAIILSGTGSDGTRGIRAVKEAGGMVMAQDEESAKFDGMPRSVISTQLVDFISPPEQMPEKLLGYLQHPCLKEEAGRKPALSTDPNTLNKIFMLLRDQTGIDFSYYKPNTMVRRIQRRMGINQVESLDNYFRYLQQSPRELNTLYKELLIGVTRFFRDPEAFEFLRQEIIPLIFQDKDGREQVRMWVAGCSTGEEAYSLAILFKDYMRTNGLNLDVKIFATDIDKEALEFASRGIYSESIAADISWEQLKDYFIKKGESYEIIRPLREMVIFARQNLIKDPPFSKIDLITCRNVLIYFQPVLQKRALSTFQFALRPNGFLFLGSSETLGETQKFFHTYHNKWKIYQHKGDMVPLSEETGKRYEEFQPDQIANYGTARVDERRATENLYKKLIEKSLPPSIIVDENAELIHAFGEINRYLHIPSGGRVTLNVLKMARSDLSITLGTAIHKVLKEKRNIVYKNVILDEEDRRDIINLIAQPFAELEGPHASILIQFQPIETGQPIPAEHHTFDKAEGVNQRITDLEQELQYTRENLQATIEELETSNEELQATNEELLAANEELQSTNEELQSVNEELITVNAEHQAKIEELTQLNNDINNLLANTNVGIIFLDTELHIRKFTPAAQEEINLLEQDIGRPISHISHHLEGCDLAQIAAEVLETARSYEEEVHTPEDKAYLLRIVPYRTVEDRIEGVVLVLMDVSELSKAHQEILKKEELIRRLQKHSLKPVEILLVEDNADQVERMQEKLLPATRLHYNLHLAWDGTVALDFLRRQNGHEEAPRPDLIILDLGLPMMDGREVLSQIKQDTELNNIPILVITASEDERDILTAYNLKTNAYLTKPFNTEQLLQAINAAFDSFQFVVVKAVPEDS